MFRNRGSTCSGISIMINKLEDYKDIRVNWLLPQPVNLTFRGILQIAYAVICMLMLVKYSRKHKTPKYRSGRQSNFVYPFLWMITLFVFLIAAYYMGIVVLYYQNPDMGRRLMFEYQKVYVMGGVLTFLPFLILLWPEILYGIPKYRPFASVSKKHEDMPAQEPVKKPTSSDNTASSTEQDTDDKDAQADPFVELGARIHALMEKEQPYLQEDFSLEDLARALDVPKHHIYYCLKNVLQTRFVALRIDYRIAHAKKLLVSTDLSNTTLEQIGLASGFSTRSGFYKMFKAEVGCSPGEFIEQHQRPE
jgi:AraC-like DNA-binding protein